MKIQKKKIGGCGGGLGQEGRAGGGVRVEVNEELKFLGKFTQKNIRWCRDGGSDWGVGLVGGQGGCERRIKGFCENSKENWGVLGGVGGWVGGWVRGVRVDVNEELMFLGNFTNNGGGGVGRGSGWWVRLDVNEELKFL